MLLRDFEEHREGLLRKFARGVNPNPGRRERERSVRKQAEKVVTHEQTKVEKVVMQDQKQVEKAVTHGQEKVLKVVTQVSPLCSGCPGVWDHFHAARVGEARNPGPPLMKGVEELQIWSINVGEPIPVQMVEKLKDSQPGVVMVQETRCAQNVIRAVAGRAFRASYYAKIPRRPATMVTRRRWRMRNCWLWKPTACTY